MWSSVSLYKIIPQQKQYLPQREPAFILRAPQATPHVDVETKQPLQLSPENNTATLNLVLFLNSTRY